MTDQEAINKLKEIELLCQIFMRQPKNKVTPDYTEGMAKAAEMALKIINRKGPAP